MVKKKIVKTQGFVRAEYMFWVGKYLDAFYENLQKKKIIGNKCPKCGKVFVPPRNTCGECQVTIPLGNWVEVKDTGTVMNYTSTTYLVTEVRRRTRKEPALIGMVKLDGSDTAVIYELKMEEAKVKTGMKVKVVWNEKLVGAPADIKGFAPAGGV
jgi:uncharacterized OB-fold protein